MCKIKSYQYLTNVLQMIVCKIFVRFYLTNILQILICKIFIFLGDQDLGLEMEIGTTKIENGKDWDCKVPGKHVENSANSTIYVLPKVLDVYYNLAVS